GLFWLTAGLALVAIAVVQWVTPSGDIKKANLTVLPAKKQLHNVLTDNQLQRTNLGILLIHLFLTAIFVVLPAQLIAQDLPLSSHSLIYLVLLLTSFIAMLPALIWVEKNKAHKIGFIVAVSLLLVANLVLGMSQSLNGLLIGLGLFFFAFNFLEASLPALVSRLCSVDNRGTAMGVYSTSQFSGAFLGGTFAGLVMQYGDYQLLFLSLAFMSLIWLFTLIGMKSLTE
ncbi:MAG: MFS transporter, partial [Gammaproteobacteria bacterium]|nr:MFS transporter [Gammaproteobacteria bacterium]